MPQQKKGKPFPWQISRREAERLQNIEVLYNRLRNKEIMDPFVKEMGESIMLILSQKPMTEWPMEALVSFEHVRRMRKYDFAVQMFLENLPKAVVKQTNRDLASDLHEDR